jgi:hypothetical protein
MKRLIAVALFLAASNVALQPLMAQVIVVTHHRRHHRRRHYHPVVVVRP